jgi:xanthine dehydrogenase accessory factor
VGSKRKLAEFFKILSSEGVSSERLDHVHSPVGLDIGALTPEEIAVSIVAEMIAIRRNVAGSAASLAWKPGVQQAS